MGKAKAAAIALVAVIAIAVAVTFAVEQLAEEPPADSRASDTRSHGSVWTGGGSPVLGSPDAPVTIVEFGDYQCHQCYNWFHNTRPALYDEYVWNDRANVVFVDMAFLGRDSPLAAQATYCAEDQGAYWQYHDMLYRYQEPQIDNGWAGRDRLDAFALQLGLDVRQFSSCMDSQKYKQRVADNVREGRDQGVTGTPTFVIVFPDGQEERLVGAQPLAAFQRAIDRAI